MGHLINPIAYRLGHSRSWEDNWYVKSIYYPEFLHSILKIRQYIYYFWTTRFMEKKGILLSHFYIYKFIKNLLIKIFLYNTDFEKYIYSFYVRGVGIFSDSFYYRLKKKRKRKEPFCYDRYKPDLFFPLFLYFAYFSRKKVIRRKEVFNGFKYKIKKNKKLNFNNTLISQLKKKDKYFNSYILKRKIHLNKFFLYSLKKNNLNIFFKLAKNVNKKYLSINSYENKLKMIKPKRINMGFLDFLIYIFFKINMLDKENDEIIKSRKKRRSVEMILNYSLKIKKWIKVLRKYININIRSGRKLDRKRSIKNFIFFLNFLLSVVYKVKTKSSRVNFRLKELNLKLVRLFIFSRVFNEFASFYGTFLMHIIYILTNWKQINFKFCFITNNSVNAKFLTRYIGLKLKRKFPLFYVINPLKKEFRKLSKKKKDKKDNIFFDFFSPKNAVDLKMRISYKTTFFSVLKYLYNKFINVLYIYFKQFNTLVTFDIYIYFLILKNKYKYQASLMHWKNKILIKKKKYKKKLLNKNWINFLIQVLKKKFDIKNLNKKFNLLSKLSLYIKNKLLINLFFGFNKQNVDSLVSIFFALKGDKDTFFFFNNDYVCLTLYITFYNNNSLNYNTILNMNINFITISSYFLNSFLFYMHQQYFYNKFRNYLKMNKKMNYIKIKKLYSSSSFFLGYKMSFKGRFTRKQRASSIWFHQGFVPLNTIKGCIDYSFFTIPLKNSAVSIKLWLYKNTNGVIWDTKFLNKR